MSACDNTGFVCLSYLANLGILVCRVGSDFINSQGRTAYLKAELSNANTRPKAALPIPAEYLSFKKSCIVAGVMLLIL